MKTQSDVQITIRVDKNLKERAENLFNRLGMNMSTALNIFLRKAVNEDAIPFAVSAKRSGFGAGLSSEDVSTAFTAAVQREIAKNQQNGFPVAEYDRDTKRS
ncbi:MAG: type II toxin-antitoxin system RelB/DinJ family antitoxin [Thermincola sp.]|jgi:DNA-damage-inducible protein J|nr:type II toxin-antitoxin system RelB/DinJ family antitoxin [Thermincola sp.]MDT3703737.1 type II toxin-antitoxin system RelB/DinJ family antitoxin [Thermincola sp.]